jgi:dipeptidyl aminopeptidase/acylaminoacyl peptidase
MWQLGQRWLAPLADGTIAAIHGRGTGRLSILGPDGVLRAVDSPYTEWASCLAGCGTEVAAVAASTQRPHEVVRVDAVSREVRVVRAAPAGAADPAYLPQPQARAFRAADGRDIHASMYPPRNPAFTGPPDQPPPYVVFVHGGPTGRAPMVYDLAISYFTSRGLGVAEVNYGGSTGYGRAYRERLVHNWGLVDTADCAEVARALAAEGTADGSRLAIRGGSAGGWTTACSLVTDGTYQGGIIYYPILDLAGWRTGETHDFESQYLESLVGPWPRASAAYHDRSPVNRADHLSAPFLLLQGLEDVICPPLQAERFLKRVAGRGIPHAYLAFEGEQHGFRRAETIVAALEAELSFLGQVLGFEPSDVPRVQLVT